MARCPYNPLHNSTALITSSGDLYAATAMDFSGRDPAIYRSLGGLPPLRTAQYNSKWLNGRMGYRVEVRVVGVGKQVVGDRQLLPIMHCLVQLQMAQW